MADSENRIADARGLAAELLHRVRPGGPFLSDLFDDWAEASGLDARDRHLAHELAAGVIRHRRTLDCVLNSFSRRPLVKSPPALRVLVRLGAYQLLFLERIPDHAAVDQTVELAKQWARPRIKKHPASIAAFVNGLLRAVAAARQIVPTAADVSRRQRIERPGVSSFAVLDRDVFASPEESPGEYLADAYSFDTWLAARWVERFGLAKAVDVARAQNRRAGLAVRVNSLRVDVDNVRTVLGGDGIVSRVVRSGPPMLRILEGDAVHCKAMMMGLIQPQDPWAATVAGRLDLRPGQTVLDRCAAPGAKTAQIVEIMHNKGHVLAVDASEDGLERVRQNAKRLGCHIVETVPVEQMPQRLTEVGTIDRVLVDAPCSNSGVLARRPEARWRISAEAIEQWARSQRELLMDGLNWVAMGGKVVFSTYSIEPEEGEQVVKYALGRHHGAVRLLQEKLTLPSQADDHDGGYWAVLERVR